MENVKESSNKKKLLPIILAGLAIIIVIVLIVVATSKKEPKKPVVNKRPVNEQGQVVGEDGQPLPPEEQGMPVEGEEMMGEGGVEEVNPALVDAKSEVEGANLISKDNKVITDDGTEIRADVDQMDAAAPRQTGALDKNNIPDSVAKMDVTASGFSPAEFTAKKGSPVTISLSSNDEWSHNITFDDPKLSAISIGVSAGETRVLTFPAPAEAGEYTFYCGVPGHANRGERGKMIVN